MTSKIVFTGITFSSHFTSSLFFMSSVRDDGPATVPLSVTVSETEDHMFHDVQLC